jgi:hypothetical protein
LNIQFLEVAHFCELHDFVTKQREIRWFEEAIVLQRAEKKVRHP